MIFTLYRHYSVDDTLLYIGITVRGEKRMREHSRHANWWREVSYTRYDHSSPDLPSLMSAERDAIRTENPIHNKQRFTYETRSASDNTRREAWRTKQAIQKASKEREREFLARKLQDCYVDFCEAHSEIAGIPSGAFAIFARARNEQLNDLKPGQFKQLAVSVLGPTAPFYNADEKTMVRGWSDSVHQMNLEAAELTYGQPAVLRMPV